MTTKRYSKDGQAGFTLLETLVALSLFALVSAAMVPAFSAQIIHNRRADMKTGAFQAAQVALEDLRRISPETLPTGGAEETRVINSGDREYTVVLTFCADATYCSARSRFITATVTHREEEVYEVSTVFTRLR
jgi:prepilin-type N-terminal cleavage/methylation domain-containing protein